MAKGSFRKELRARAETAQRDDATIEDLASRATAYQKPDSPKEYNLDLTKPPPGLALLGKPDPLLVREQEA